jgi:outer membrane protein OmpA-like peptidoglycan-associated protein
VDCVTERVRGGEGGSLIGQLPEAEDERFERDGNDENQLQFIHRRNNMKSFLRALTVLAPLALVLWPMASNASSFTDALTKDYFKLATLQYYYADDKFAAKARAADKGKNVLPDNPAKLRKVPSGARRELTEAHGRLMQALNGGFRTQNPKQASRAQTSFDCWLWAVIDRDKKCIGKCRKAFLAAMKAWAPPVAKAKPMPKPVAKAKPMPAPPPPRSFTVFFDWDRANIRADAQQVIESAVAYAKRRGFSRIKLSGHADRSGKASYNMRLSDRRVNAVKAALVKLGIRAGNISSAARGESAPPVTTANNVREARNRRVEIGF